MILLEHTAGQGSTMGSIVRGNRGDARRREAPSGGSACASTRATCSHRATTCARKRATTRRSTRFEELIGFDRLKVFHLNDSKKPCMSRVDRHEHIGKGCIGLEPFRRLLNDPRFAHLPMILETEKTRMARKGKVEIDPLDEMNLNTLRSLRT